MGARVMIVDNYDSFTYNLVQYLGELGAEVEVHRNDSITPVEVGERGASHIVISPGPRTPNEAGISMDVVRELAGKVPILGVCLGHQSICQVFGGDIVRGDAPVHGKASQVFHDGRTIFAGVENPLVATRYHSLVAATPLPEELELSAWTGDDVVMGVRHRTLPALEGVQFHPESILTETGKQILGNFLDMSVEGKPHAQ